MFKTCDLKEIINIKLNDLQKICILYFIKKKNFKDIVISKENDNNIKFNDQLMTNHINYYKLDKFSNKKLIGQADIDNIQENNYSLDYKNYKNTFKEKIILDEIFNILITI